MGARTRGAESALTDVLIVGGVFRETVLRAGAAQRRLGGSGLIAAQAAALSQASVAFAAFVGADDLPLATDICESAGVQIFGAAVTPGPSASFVFHEIEGVQPPWPLLRPACIPVLAADDLSRVSAPTVLIFGSPGWNPWADEAVLAAAERSETLLWDRQGFMTATDSSVAATHTHRCRRRIQLCKLDEVAAEFRCGEFEAMQKLPQEGFSEAIVKDGPWGVTIFEPSGRVGVGVPAVSVNDTIGSGDIFAGAVAAHLAKGDNLPEAVKAGSLMAARLITSPRQPTLAATLAHAPTEETLPGARWVPPEVLRDLRIAVQPPDGPAEQALDREIKRMLHGLGLTQSQETSDMTPDLNILLRPPRTDDDASIVTVSTAGLRRLRVDLIDAITSHWGTQT